LHDYLSSHPDCGFRSVKELHYFDAAENDKWGGQIKRVENELGKLQSRQGELSGWKARRNAQRIADHVEWLDVLKGRRRDDARYGAYLAGAGGQLVGDITPSYAMLTSETLAEMTTLAEDVRFVYLIRDPVSRLWSHVRMNAGRAGGDLPVEDRAKALMDRVLNAPESDEAMHILTRGDYAGSLLRLSSVVPPTQLFVAFMEELVSPTGVQSLCEFLGISMVPGRYEKRVREGVPMALDAGRKAAAVALLQDQYDFVARIFPALPDAWHRSLGQMAA